MCKACVFKKLKISPRHNHAARYKPVSKFYRRFSLVLLTSRIEIGPFPKTRLLATKKRIKRNTNQKRQTFRENRFNSNNVFITLWPRVKIVKKQISVRITSWSMTSNFKMCAYLATASLKAESKAAPSILNGRFTRNVADWLHCLFICRHFCFLGTITKDSKLVT